MANNKMLRVVVEGETSNAAQVKCGVPQGRVLGHLMFYFVSTTLQIILTILLG